MTTERKPTVAEELVAIMNSPETKAAVAAASVERPCRFCGAEVTAGNPDTDFCAHCFYDGTFFSEGFASLLAEIKYPARISHTGGGCFALFVDREPKWRLCATVDGDGVLPDTEDGPWWVGRYDTTVEDDEGEIINDNLDRAGLLAVLNGEVPES